MHQDRPFRKVLGTGNGMKWAVNTQSAFIAKILNSDKTRIVASCRKTLTFRTFRQRHKNPKSSRSFINNTEPVSDRFRVHLLPPCSTDLLLIADMRQDLWSIQAVLVHQKSRESDNHQCYQREPCSCVVTEFIISSRHDQHVGLVCNGRRIAKIASK